MNDIISIICVTKNADKTLERCILSIVEQEYKSIELIIIDNESTDSTLEIIKKWDHKIDFWISEKDEGIYDAMNKALNHISGKWVYFIGSDDFLYSEFSTFILDNLKEKDVVYYGNLIKDEHKYGGKFSSYKLSHSTICHQAIIYPSVVFDYYRYDIRYSICADHLLNMQVYNDSRFTYKYVDKIIANFSSDGISSHQEDFKFKEDRKMYVKKYFRFWVYLRYVNRMSKKHRRF